MKKHNYSKEQAQLIKNFRDTTSSSEKQAQSYLTRAKWNIQNAINIFFDEGAAPEVQQLASTAQIEQCFRQLTPSKTNQNVRYMDEQKFEQFNNRYLKFSQENVTLGYIIINIMQVETSGYIQFKHFVKLFEYLNITDPRQLLEYTKQLQNEIRNDKFAYRQLYTRIYKFYLVGSKNMSLEFSIAEQLWRIYLRPIMPLYKQFMDYLERKTIKPTRVHKDLWSMVYDFATSVSDISKVSEMDGWPVFLDEFVEFCKQQ